ncbi:MAPEG family protein [Roseivivax sp. THAF30]|uniref:MAPEG family protein n=1 Tax=Roseivivax sp. THAF30 TaxID=2587852 RepID=UPI0012680F67|nr:MAPEG family protein [Roseivivax sp. THAF30]QFT64065.1 Inner membrane protein YecN [Roseivivax sp. THAF30]
MSVAISATYAALLTLIFIVLSVRVIQRRGETKTSLGAGDDVALERRIRAHGNFAEFAPLGIVLLLLTKLIGAPAIAVHAAGLTLLIGRGMHALALSRVTPSMPLRAGGMVLTFAMLGLTALGLLTHAIW